MTNFSDFYTALQELVKSFEAKKTLLKIEKDPDSDVVKILGENITSLSRAKNGLESVDELALTTAEHHPYWNLLNQCSQISKIILDKWDDNLSQEEIDEIQWAIEQLKNTCEKIKESR